MKRFITFSIAAALVAGFTNSAWSQGGQGGGGGTSGGAGTSGTSGSAGTSNRSGTAGTAATPGTAGAAARTQLGTGQNQVSGGFQARTTVPGQTPGSTFWFNDPAIRQQLNLNDAQFIQLSRAYWNPWMGPNQVTTGQGTATAAAQRQQRLQEFQDRFDTNGTNAGRANAAAQRQQQLQQFQDRFDTDFNTTLDQVFTDTQLRQRFDQLNRQFMGPLAFNDPLVQRQLNLTQEQQLALRRLAAGWRDSLVEMRRSAPADPNLTQQQWNTFRTQYRDQLATILTPAQQQRWTQLTGRPYDFPMTTYLRAGADPNSTVDQNLIDQNEALQRAQRNNRTGQPRGTIR
jgi:hypothetical protein